VYKYLSSDKYLYKYLYKYFSIASWMGA